MPQRVADRRLEPQLQTLRWQLLGSFLAVMFGVLGLGAIATVEFFAQSLRRQLDSQLFVLAQAASHSLDAIAMAHRDRIVPVGQPRHLDNQFFSEHQELQLRLDDDGDLDLPWESLQKPEQGVEWYSQRGELLARQGSVFPKTPVMLIADLGGVSQDEDHLRIFTLPIFSLPDINPGVISPGVISPSVISPGGTPMTKVQPIGFVRVAERLEPIEDLLNDLMWGMVAGMTVALILMGFGGLWLTRQALRPIAQSFRQLRQFTADASHELRGPLTALRTSIAVMADHPERIHPSDRRKVSAMASAVDQMTRLVEDLLLLARSDAVTGSVAHERVRLDLEELLADLVETYHDRAEAAGLSLSAQLEPATITADPILLWRLFGNLLENAIEYTPSGGQVRLALKSKRQLGDRDQVQIQVTDTGIGIAADDLPHIFDRLWRADEARHHRQAGSGLGLAIAQAIVQAHQGTLTVSSTLGQGTTFTVILAKTA